MTRTASRVARAAALGTVGWRLARGGRPQPPVGTGRSAASVRPIDEISVVVPARDEAERIGPLLSRIVGAPGVAEVIVVDDESTDRTADLAAAAGAAVVVGRPRPQGWAGKTWALEQGLAAAASPWVVTLDADTLPDPELPAALVGRMRAAGLDLLTVGGRFECPTAGSRWLHASMLTTLVYRFGPPGGSRPAPPGRLLANGQCMAFRRDRLTVAGGFESVAGSVVEDVALARTLAALGWKVAFLDASELLTVRMFDDLASTWRGWGRSLGLPGVEPRSRRSLDALVLALTMPVPMIRLTLGLGDPIDLAALAVRAGTLVGTARAYERTDSAYWLSPLADAAAVAALVVGVARRSQTWRGRTYAV